MIKLGAIALGTLLLFSGSAVSVARPSQEEVRYRDTAAIAYDESVSRAASTENVTINYSTRTISETRSLAYRYPCYEYSPAYGSCAAIAGANVIGFYDRYDENLIPNHQSGSPIGNTYAYSLEDEAVKKVIVELYKYMGTTTSGTTEQKFKDGMEDFCKDKGHSITFSSCMQGDAISYSKAKSYLDANQPVILFLSSYNVGTITQSTNYDKIEYYVSDVAHIMIAFGYRTYVYNGSSTYQYLNVASGVSGYASGLFNINYKTKINNALAVNIT